MKMLVRMPAFPSAYMRAQGLPVRRDLQSPSVVSSSGAQEQARRHQDGSRSAILFISSVAAIST